MKSSISEPGRSPGGPQRPEIKADRPRPIDRYIDYFGERLAPSTGSRDPRLDK